MRSKGQVTIPADIRKAAHIDEGDPLEFEVVAGGILLRPQKIIDSSQAWFWTTSWQAGEAEAEAELQTGTGTKYDSAAAFLASFDS